MSWLMSSRKGAEMDCAAGSHVDGVVKVLEAYVKKQQQEAAVLRPTPSTSGSAGVFHSPSPKKMFQHTARTPQLNRTLVGKALLQYQKASLGCKTRPKDVDNARTRRCHAIRFCAYMSKGEGPKQHTLTAGNQKTFMEAAKKEIPKLLKKLQAACTHSQLELVYGYISGYLAIVSGHRPVVFTSMRMIELIDAEYKDDKYVVWVKDHKTQKSFGHATLPMYAEEYRWLRDVADLVHDLFPESDLVFERRDGKPVTKLNQLLRNAWKHAGLSGDITFNMVRSSVSTQAKKHLTAEERSRVATSMCHDVATAEKFYRPVPELADAFQPSWAFQLTTHEYPAHIKVKHWFTLNLMTTTTTHSPSQAHQPCSPLERRQG
ncbi:unnamed protein product [Lota lota]